MFLVCGEALVDLIVATAEGRPVLDARLGGAPFNVAIGLARLGERTAFYGGISTDPLGEALVATLSREGVDTGCVRRSAAPTMLVTVGLDAAGAPRYGFPISNGADRVLPAADAPLPWGGAIGAAIFGSYPAVLPPTAAALLSLANRVSAITLICLDPNVRPAIAPDPAVWRQGVDAFLPLTDIVKASDEDIRLIYGSAASPEAMARDWLGRGPQLVCVTRGAAGASLYGRGGLSITVPAPAVAVVDTVGAGDAFLAAFLSTLSRHAAMTRPALASLTSGTIEAAMRAAIAAATVTCTRRGADLPRWDDLGDMA